MEENTNKIKNINNSQIYYFEVDSDKEFVRVFADLVEQKKYELIITRDGKNYVIPSVYNIDEMREGEIIHAFAYAKKAVNNGKAMLYPLPMNSQFDESQAIPLYNTLSNNDYDKLVYENETIIAKRKTYNQKRSEFLRNYEILKNFMETDEQFAETIKNLSTIASVKTNSKKKTKSIEAKLMSTNDMDKDEKVLIEIKEKKTRNSEVSSKKARKRANKRIKELF